MQENRLNHSAFTINGERLWHDLMQFGEIGRGEDGGVTRTSFDAGDMHGRSFLISLLENAGLKPQMDAAGNIYGEIQGTEPDLPFVLLGSHIDSVKSGGRFDGTMGVLIGIEVLRTMKEQGIQPKRTVRVISFTDEEGARFNYAFLGSLALTGEIPAAELTKQLTEARDSDGVSYADAMRAARMAGGLFSRIDPDALAGVKLKPGACKAYLEVHIEQGKVLEERDLGVGIVTGITGGEWWEVTVSGQAGHAGTMGMKGRRDALAASSECILAIEHIAAMSGGSVATVGVLNVKPGSSNVIPGRVEYTLDIRDISDERRRRTSKAINEAIVRICEARNVSCVIKKLQELPSVFSAPEIMQAMREACMESEYPVYELPSGAAHDAMVMAGVTQMGMLFVKSKEGISHHPDEWSKPEDVSAACEILYKTVLRLL